MDAQGSSYETDQVAYDAPTEGKQDGIPRAPIQEQEILHRGFPLAALGGLPRGNDMGQKTLGWRARLGRRRDGGGEFGEERGEVEFSDICVCDEDVGRGGEGCEDCVDYVRDQVEAAVDGFFAKDGDLEHVVVVVVVVVDGHL